MTMEFELNNVRKDINNYKIKKDSPVVRVFAAMVKGQELNSFGKVADKAVEYIKELGRKAGNGSTEAAMELNTIRRFVVEAPVMEEIRMLSVFGTYQAVGYDETIEREVWREGGEFSRTQAGIGDVPFPIHTKEVYPVPSFTVSGGYQVDYRRVELGDMSRENEGMNHVKTDILNSAKVAIVKRVYDAIKNASGIKYIVEQSNLTKSGVDELLVKIRRMGRPTILGDYAMLSQFTPWAGYVGKIDTTTITGISEQAMNEIAQNGLLGMYNGCVLALLENPYNYYQLNEAGDNYATLLPAGLAFVIPTGGQESPIATWTRGGLTSLTGNDIKTGKILTRFDLEVACDVAKGQENRIGLLYDTQIAGL